MGNPKKKAHPLKWTTCSSCNSSNVLSWRNIAPQHKKLQVTSFTCQGNEWVVQICYFVSLWQIFSTSLVLFIFLLILLYIAFAQCMYVDMLTFLLKVAAHEVFSNNMLFVFVMSKTFQCGFRDAFSRKYGSWRRYTVLCLVYSITEHFRLWCTSKFVVKTSVSTVYLSQVTLSTHLSNNPIGKRNSWVSCAPTAFVRDWTRANGFIVICTNHYTTEV